MSQVGIRQEEATGRSRRAPPRGVRRKRFGQRARAVIFGVIAGLGLIVLIALGSRGFHWFDAALIGYAVGSVFAFAAVVY
jgi:hypothetical protein